MGMIARILIPCIKTAAFYIVPEVVNYLARKLVSYLKKKNIKEKELK